MMSCLLMSIKIKTLMKQDWSLFFSSKESGYQMLDNMIQHFCSPSCTTAIILSKHYEMRKSEQSRVGELSSSNRCMELVHIYRSLHTVNLQTAFQKNSKH